MIQTKILEIIPGISIEYLFKGPGYAPVVVFLHELGTNLHQFDIQQLLLSQKYQILQISFRGHGFSRIRKPLQPEQFTIDQLATDILSVMRSLEIQKAHFVGNGLGYLTCLKLFNLSPQSVHSLTSFGSFPAPYPQSFLKRALHQITDSQKPGRKIRKFMRSLENKALQKQLSVMSQYVSQEALHYLPQHISRFDSGKILQNSTSIPKLFILCGQECEFSLKFFTETFQSSKAQHFQIEKICSAEHFANMENPFQFNQIITDFIQAI